MTADVEALVPYDSTLDIAAIRENPQYAGITFVEMGQVATDSPAGTESAAHEMYDRRTAAGLCAASGEILALLQDYGAPAPDWCEQVLLAHEMPHGVIGGSVEHAGQGPWNWAVYFLGLRPFSKALARGPVGLLDRHQRVLQTAGLRECPRRCGNTATRK